jgi:hypothetical protein
VIAIPKQLNLGQIVATPAALAAIEGSNQNPADFLRRHASKDWGDVADEDKRLNDEAVQDGSRILSAYHTSNGTKLWIITEAEDDQGNRAATTILLPEQY